MLWSLFARRYMFSPKSHSVINLIASVSVVAVMIPTAAMIILLAMFEGLGGTIREIYDVVDADIEILPSRGQTFERDAVDVAALMEVEGIEAATPYLEQSVMASAAGRRTMITLRGVEPSYTDVIPIEEHISKGDYSSLEHGDVVLGSTAASQLGAYGIGTTIELYALNRKQISTLLPTNGIRRERSALGGVILSNAEVGATLALCDISLAEQLMNHDGRLSGIALRLDPKADIASVEAELGHSLGEQFDVRTRDEKSASMNAILRMERFAIVLIGLMISLVATFAIVGSVVMLITDKRRDILTLRAMGADSGLIRRIFIGEGMLLCAVGCLLGTLLGVALSLGQQHFGWVRIPGDSIIESYPVELHMEDVALVALIVLGIGCLVSQLTVRATLIEKP